MIPRFLTPRKELQTSSLTRPNWLDTRPRAPDRIWLDKNENLDPELLLVIREVRNRIPIETISLYPDLGELYVQMAKIENVSASELLLTAGSDAAIRTVFETFISPGDRVVLTQPTFAMYAVYAKIFGAMPIFQTYERSEAGPTLNWSKMLKDVESLKPRLICLPNPDSPTGTVIAREKICDLLRLALSCESLVMIDEAYHPFYPQTLIREIREFPNLIVARTFSKAWGLAGLRLGFLAAQSEMIQLLNKVRPMYEIGAYAASFLNAMLPHHERIQESVAKTIEGRDLFQQKATALGLGTYPSFGNFFHLNLGSDRAEIIRRLDEKILFRASFNDDALINYCRITAAPWSVLEPVYQILAG